MPETVWLTEWALLDGRQFVEVTGHDAFKGLLDWKQGGSWEFDPTASRVRPRLGVHWQRARHIPNEHGDCPPWCPACQRRRAAASPPAPVDEHA